MPGATGLRLPSLPSDHLPPMPKSRVNVSVPLRRVHPTLGVIMFVGGVLLLLAGLALLVIITPVMVAVVMITQSIGLTLAMAGITLTAVACIPLSVLVLDRGIAQFDRRYTGRCPRCDYDLRGSEMRVCPECGAGS